MHQYQLPAGCLNDDECCQLCTYKYVQNAISSGKQITSMSIWVFDSRENEH